MMFSSDIIFVNPIRVDLVGRDPIPYIFLREGLFPFLTSISQLHRKSVYRMTIRDVLAFTVPVPGERK